ncbi:MAG: hypothetical protein ABI575_08860 [Oxalobacteraceae bacterium]
MEYWDISTETVFKVLRQGFRLVNHRVTWQTNLAKLKALPDRPNKVAEMDGDCHEAEFAYWRKSERK